jgi:hypothetical protein
VTNAILGRQRKIERTAAVFERHSEPLASRGVFLRRLATSSGIGLIAILVFLFAGMLCFHYIEALDAMDSFLNAAMFWVEWVR